MIGAMSKRGQDTTSSDGTHQYVATGQCKEDVLPQRPGSLVNLEDEDDRKKSWLGLEKRSLKFPSEPTTEG